MFVVGITAVIGQHTVEINNRKHIERERDELLQRSLSGFEIRMLWLHGMCFTLQGAPRHPRGI